MLKKIYVKYFSFFIFFFMSFTSAFALEDCVIFSDGKLTDISIEDNTVIDVYPLITIMNEKNTLIVHPLKLGKTRFCILKNGKEKVMFNVLVEEDRTLIDEVEGFSILQIDEPPNINEYDIELDLPPIGIGDNFE